MCYYKMLVDFTTLVSSDGEVPAPVAHVGPGCAVQPPARRGG